MSVRKIALLSAAICCFLSATEGDPCNTNFGDCDQINGLCWGTGATTHFCSCKAGFVENTTSPSHTCLDVDECAENICGDHAICNNSVGSYTCTCMCGYVKDYTGERCLNVFDISDSCYVPKECCHPTLSGRKHFDPVYGDQGWLPCPDSGIKILQPNDCPTCSCKKGFKLNHCGYCTDFDECANNETNECDLQNGFCTNTEGSYFCLCNPGYTLGPCRRRCYSSNETVPVLCNTPDLSGLSVAEPVPLETHTYLAPFVLTNYETCAENVTVGESVVESFDVDGNGQNDVTLTWSCTQSFTVEDPTGMEVTIRLSTLSLYADKEAHWDAWSCWSVCKATCWGGIQTRTRYCLHGRPGIGGCQGVGSEKRECYTGTKCPFRIRKDVRSLTADEVADLVQAMQKYKEDFSVRGFHHAAGSHGWPFQCEGGVNCCPHGARMRFVAWHRYIVLNFEEGLTRYMNNTELGIPYWNWLDENASPPGLAWNGTINGSPNPFLDMLVLIDRPGPERSTRRTPTIEQNILEEGRTIWRDVTRNLMKIHLMHEFAESLEMAHNNPHTAICSEDLETSPTCQISMATLAFAAFDPIFLLHHSQVDRMWAIEQDALYREDNFTWTKQTAMQPLDDLGDFGRVFQPYGNTTINSFKIVQNTGNIHDSAYYKELTGIQYESLEDPIPTAAPFASRFMPVREGGPETLFIAHHLANVDVDVYINYYLDIGAPCENLELQFLVGRANLLATNQPNFNSIPNLINVQTSEFVDRLSDSFPIRACYTNSSTCRENCPSVSTPAINALPSPALLYFYPNERADVYKFNWSPQNRMPQWVINIYGASQFVHFFGQRSENILQVRTVADWTNCNSTISRPVPCFNGNACILPLGLYFFIDSNSTECNNGLKMIIASAK